MLVALSAARTAAKKAEHLAAYWAELKAVYSVVSTAVLMVA